MASLISKFVFAMTFLLSLQLPLFTDHYHQFLAGYVAATKAQVEGYAATARQHEYASVEAMIADHLQNTTPSVRTDALQKQLTLATYDDLQAALPIFEKGNVIEQYWFIVQPDHAHFFRLAVENYSPGLPLTPGGLAMGFIVAFLISAFFSVCYRKLWLRR